MSKSFKYVEDDDGYEDRKEKELTKAMKKLAKLKQHEDCIDESVIQRGLSRDYRKKT